MWVWHHLLLSRESRVEVLKRNNILDYIWGLHPCLTHGGCLLLELLSHYRWLGIWYLELLLWLWLHILHEITIRCILVRCWLIEKIELWLSLIRLCQVILKIAISRLRLTIYRPGWLNTIRLLLWRKKATPSIYIIILNWHLICRFEETTHLSNILLTLYRHLILLEEIGGLGGLYIILLRASLGLKAIFLITVLIHLWPHHSIHRGLCIITSNSKPLLWQTVIRPYWRLNWPICSKIGLTILRPLKPSSTVHILLWPLIVIRHSRPPSL